MKNFGDKVESEAACIMSGETGRQTVELYEPQTKSLEEKAATNSQHVSETMYDLRKTIYT